MSAVLGGKNYYEVEGIVHAKRNGAGKDFTIIDVRDPDERESEGFVPYSINIPAYEMSSALKMRGAAFAKKYGTAKPGKNDNIILYCRSGQRSHAVGNFLINERYQRVFTLSGGHDEWQKNQQLTDDADL